MIKLYPHQQQALDDLKDLNKCALYWDMGLGKTFGGSEKMYQLGAKVNLVICQKSKIDDWMEHFKENYPFMIAVNLTLKNGVSAYMTRISPSGTNTPIIGVINYELAFRRPELAQLKDFTLMLDESSLIQNEHAKRSAFILKKLKPKNVILLSGTPTGGKYEKLWSQLHLLGWKISKTMFFNQFVRFHYEHYLDFPLRVIDGYKNEERLKRKMREYGCHFLKTEEVFDLPEQIHQTIKVQTTKEYRKFRKDCIITITKREFAEWKDDSDFYGEDITPRIELVGDTTLTKMLYERQLCGQYNKAKLEAFSDLLESTNDRLIVFYNFTEELEALCKIAWDSNRPVAVVNGKQKDLLPYENVETSITFIQYQAGAMGLNLQKANKIIYFTPPLSSELFEQSKKRIHRIGQEKSCFYYYLTCKNSIEEKIYKTLAMRRNYTEALFEQEE